MFVMEGLNGWSQSETWQSNLGSTTVANTLLHNELLHDNPQTVARLDSIAGLFEWMQALPPAERKRFLARLAECGDAVQQVVTKLIGVIKNPDTTPAERQRTLSKIADALFINPDETDKVPRLACEVEKMNTHQATFAQRLRELMEAKRISQQELADRAHCTQPAISQMLNRACRPQKKTILKLAEVLNVQARDLWPDIDVAEALDAVASFQQPDYVMTPAEAKALADTSKRNSPKIRAKSLPTRPRKQG
jgi:transcriptional regulator with XRE-family HTH domain